VKYFIRLKLIQTLAALVIVAAVIFVPLSGNIMHSYADSGFSIVPSQNPGANNELRSVTSISSDNAWAVGDYLGTDNHTHTLIEHWDGSSWTQQTSPNPGANVNKLYGVKALSATDIWAVGFYVDANGFFTTLFEHSTDEGSTWTQDTDSYIGQGQLTGIDGDPTSGDAWAVGVGNGHALTLHLVNGHFSQQTNVLQSQNIVLNSVSEYSSSDVWAVGTTGGATGTAFTYTMHYDGNGWTFYSSPSPFQYSYLYGVTVIGTNDAWAVGTNDATGFLTHWNGSAWSTPITVPVGSSGSELYAVAATSSDNIWATGQYWDDKGVYPLAWHSADGGANWTQVTAESPSNGIPQFNSLTIDKNTGNIWAVGYSNLSSISGNTLIEQYVPSASPPVTHWQSPQNGFYIQGISVPLSVGITSGASQITGVTFTASWDSNSNVPICNGVLTNGNWVCKWGMKYNNNTSFVRNGPITLGYTVATTGGTIVNPNGTRSGTIVYEQTDKNAAYAGYATASHNNTVVYSTVVAKWKVPTVVTCGILEKSESAVWDGIASKTQIVQIGTESNCTFGKREYSAVWQVWPSSAQTIPYTVAPGDNMVATVAYVSTQNVFQMTLEDNGKWKTPPIVPVALTDPSERIYGECIVEDPSSGSGSLQRIYSLTNFGKVSIDCLVDSLPVANGPEDIKFVMVNSSNVQKTVTNALQTNGEVFSVVWKRAS
jgi:hypothetical protein